MYSGISEKRFTERLTEEGLSKSEIDYIIKKMEIDWLDEACHANYCYQQHSMYYDRDDLYDNLIYLGFDEDIAYRVSRNSDTKPYPYDSNPLGGSLKPSKNTFGGVDISKPINLFEP